MPAGIAVTPPSQAQTGNDTYAKLGVASKADTAPSQNPGLKLPVAPNIPQTLGDVLFTHSVMTTMPPDDIALGLSGQGGFYWATGRDSVDGIKRLWKLDSSGNQVAVFTQDLCCSSTLATGTSPMTAASFGPVTSAAWTR